MVMYRMYRLNKNHEKIVGIAKLEMFKLEQRPQPSPQGPSNGGIVNPPNGISRY